jgi:hypothetical protein
MSLRKFPAIHRYSSNYTNRLVFVMEGRCVFCEVWTDLLNITEISFVISMALHICYTGAAKILSKGGSARKSAYELMLQPFKTGYRLRAAAARGNVCCFSSQSRYRVAARELGAWRAKSERFSVPRQRDFGVHCSFRRDGLGNSEKWGRVSINGRTRLPRFDARRKHENKRTSLQRTNSCAAAARNRYPAWSYSYGSPEDTSFRILLLT